MMDAQRGAVAAPAAVGAPLALRSRWGLVSREARGYWLFALPALLTVAVFVVVPLAYAFALSLRDFSLLRLTDRFVGFANYARILGDHGFARALLHTALYVGAVVGADFVYGFTVALVLYELSPPWARVFRGVFMLPILLIPVAAAGLWRYVMFAPPSAVFNRLLGLPSTVDVLASGTTALWAVILAAIWGWSPFVLLLLLGGLEGLPREPLEAAELDGVTYLQKVWYIILPMMRPIVFVTLSYKAMDSFLSFTYPWVMTEGGPAGASHLLSTYIYEQSFKFLDYGYGSAMALVMMAVAFASAIGAVAYAKRRGYA
jgi:ABC-type sugar transport system permease subunit